MKYLFLAFLFASPCAAFAQSYDYGNDHGQAAAAQQYNEIVNRANNEYQQQETQQEIKSEQTQINTQQQDVNRFNNASPIERMSGNY